MGFLQDCTGDSDRQLLERGNLSYRPDAPDAITTAGAATYTGDNICKGIIKRDPNGASRTDVLPTAVLLAAAMRNRLGGGLRVGSTVRCIIVNDADAAETITLTLGSGMTSGHAGTQYSAAIAQNTNRTLEFRVTDATLGAETMTVYALATA